MLRPTEASSQGHEVFCFVFHVYQKEPYVIFIFNRYGTIFKNILLFMLLQLSQFSPCATLHPAHPAPTVNPHTVVHVRESCIYVL